MMRHAQEALDGGAAMPTLPTAPVKGTMTRSGMSLADLKPGECGYITRLMGAPRGRLRLLEMGLTPGTHVKVTRAAAFGGPLDINVRGYQLSLRREEAATVWLGDEDDS
jgi:Fe2+ transport system protein FeoA